MELQFLQPFKTFLNSDYLHVICAFIIPATSVLILSLEPRLSGCRALTKFCVEPSRRSSWIRAEPLGTQALGPLALPSVAVYSSVHRLHSPLHTFCKCVASGSRDCPAVTLSRTVPAQCQVRLPVSLDLKSTFPEGNLISLAGQVPPADPDSRGLGSRPGRGVGRQDGGGCPRVGFFRRACRQRQCQFESLRGCLSCSCKSTLLHNHRIVSRFYKNRAWLQALLKSRMLRIWSITLLFQLN